MPVRKNQQFSGQSFDADYYQRFYVDADTRAVSNTEQQRQARFIAAYVEYLELPIEAVLDIGCGLGGMLAALQTCWPEAHSSGVEFSPYLCEKYGWAQGSVVDYAGPSADLVVCNDVLGYLDEAQCQLAINNLANLTRQALYISVLTVEDLPVCDQEHTDMQQNLRPAAWYREALAEHFVSVGGGLFLRKPLQTAIWQLERG